MAKNTYQWGSGIVLNVIPDLLINAIILLKHQKHPKQNQAMKMYLHRQTCSKGRWPAILAVLVSPYHPIINTRHALPGRCTDRFRYDDIDGHGTFICNRGGNGILSGDGFALIQHKTGATSSEALNMVWSIVLPDYQKKPLNQSKTIQHQSTDEEEIETHQTHHAATMPCYTVFWRLWTYSR